MSVVNDIYQKQKEKSFRLGRYTKYCRQVYISVRTEGDRTRLNNKSKHALLNSMAKDWGTINERRTVLNENGLLIKHYSCSGHGGYLVASDELLEWSSYSPKTSQKDYPGIVEGLEFYIYEFEEDCGWAELYVKGTDRIKEAMDKDYIKSWEEWDREPPHENLKELAEKTYKRWFNQTDN